MIDLFPQVTATLTRTPSTYVDGRVVPGAPVVSSVSIVVPQPASQRELQQLPDGERSFDHQKTWTESEPFLNRDTLTYNGKTFKVVAVSDWVDPDTMQTYYKALIREVTHVN